MSEFPALRRPSYFRRRREKAERGIVVQAFEPIWRNPLKAQTKIKMLNSVGGKFTNGSRYSLTAGKEYWVDTEKADEFIVKGYATGNLSRNYSDDEVAHIRSGITVISLDSGGLISG